MMKTFKDVFLSGNLAINESGLLFDGKTQPHRRGTVYGVGINDVPFATSQKVNGKVTVWSPYTLWKNMLYRAYGPSAKTLKPTYELVSVADDWHKFSNFLEWLFKQEYFQGAELDKDLLDGTSKQYSKETCLMVPRWVNLFASDHAAQRSAHGIGIYPSGKRFVVKVSNRGNGQVVVGTFNCLTDAKAARVSAKVDMLIERREELLAIHPSLFDSIKAIIEDQ